MNSFERNKKNSGGVARFFNLRCGLSVLLIVWIFIAMGSMVFLSSTKKIEHKIESPKSEQVIEEPKTTEKTLEFHSTTFHKTVPTPPRELSSTHASIHLEPVLNPEIPQPVNPSSLPWNQRNHGKAPQHPALIGSTWPPPDPRMLAKRRVDPSDQFPPHQSESLCEAKGLSGGSYDANKQVLDNIDVAPDNSDGHSIMCIIYTIEKNHGAAKTCRDTWASHCDGFVTMSNAQDDTIPAAHVTHEGSEEYNNIWQKVRSIWKYVNTSYSNEFDWFMIGGDDLFIIPSNLRAYLNSPKIKEAAKNDTPLFLGRRFQIPKGQLFNSGGAGYILNRASLRLLNAHLDDPKCRPHQKVFAEDVNVAACLSAFGVIPFDTRDVEESTSTTGRDLRERFHPFTPGQHFTWRPPKKRKPDGSSADWYDNYNAPWGIGQGKECCSRQSASFHYVKPNLMPHLYALLYSCR